MKKIFFVLLLCCVLLPKFAFGGAWTLPQRKIWLEYYMKTQWSKSQYKGDDIARHKYDARAWGWSMAPKIEFGLTDWITLLAGLDYKEAKYKEYKRPEVWKDNYSVKNHGLTEVQFGTRIRILKEPLVLSTQIKAQIYTGYADNMYDKQEQPGLSDRCDSLEIRAMIGRKFDLFWPIYFGMETGYRWRNREVCNDVPFFVEAGFWPLKWLLIKTEIDGYWCHEGTGDIEKDYAIWRIGPVFHLLSGENVVREGNAIDIALQYGNTFAGNNTSRDQEVILKVSAQF